MLKYLSLIVLFIFSLIYFAPKENLYFLLLSNLQKENIVIKSQNTKDDFFKFSIYNSNILYQGVDALDIKEISVQTSLFNSSIDILDISLDASIKQFLPSQIKFIQLSHSIVNPLFIDIKANLIQAKAYGVVDIINQKVILNIIPSKQFLRSYKKLLREMKKQQNGEYRIEYQL